MSEDFTKKLSPSLSETTEERQLYKGPLKELCEIAPLNVNSMAILAIASGLGFENIQASLYADQGSKSTGIFASRF